MLLLHNNRYLLRKRRKWNPLRIKMFAQDLKKYP